MIYYPGDIKNANVFADRQEPDKRLTTLSTRFLSFYAQYLSLTTLFISCCFGSQLAGISPVGYPVLNPEITSIDT
jgi:hypothetical protein